MAQSTILAAGTTAATSTDVIVAAGESATVGIFAADPIPPSVRLLVMLDTPDDDVEIGSLTRQSPALLVSGPATVRVKRAVLEAVAVGVFSET